MNIILTDQADNFIISNYQTALNAMQQIQQTLASIPDAPTVLSDCLNAWTPAMQADIPDTTDTLVRKINGQDVGSGSTVYANMNQMSQFLSALNTLLSTTINS